MPRHVSAPRMLSWRQRVAIGAPVLVLAGVAAFALTSGDASTPTTVRTGDDVAGRTVASSAPIATESGEPQAGSSDPDRPRDDTRGNEPEPTPDGDRGGSDRDDEQTTRDAVSRNEDSDHGTSPEQMPRQDDDESTIDPDTGDTDGGSDDRDKEQDHSNTDDGDSDDGDSGDEADPTTPPTEDETDEANTIDRREALQRCREALSGSLGLGGIGGAVHSCVEDLISTPLARVDAKLDRTVGDLLSELREDSAG